MVVNRVWLEGTTMLVAIVGLLACNPKKAPADLPHSSPEWNRVVVVSGAHAKAISVALEDFESIKLAEGETRIGLWGSGERELRQYERGSEIKIVIGFARRLEDEVGGGADVYFIDGADFHIQNHYVIQ